MDGSSTCRGYGNRSTIRFPWLQEWNRKQGHCTREGPKSSLWTINIANLCRCLAAADWQGDCKNLEGKEIHWSQRNICRTAAGHESVSLNPLLWRSLEMKKGVRKCCHAVSEISVLFSVNSFIELLYKSVITPSCIEMISTRSHTINQAPNNFTFKHQSESQRTRQVTAPWLVWSVSYLYISVRVTISSFTLKSQDKVRFTADTLKRGTEKLQAI